MSWRDRRSRGRDRREGSALRRGQPPRWRAVVALCCLLLSLLPPATGQEENAPSENSEPLGVDATIVTVFLPLEGTEDDRAISQIHRAVARLAGQGNNRPLLILEFVMPDGTSGEGTGFESALKIARALTSEKVSGVRTIAWLPQSVRGHGVLPVIACDEIIMARDAELGAAGIEETEIAPVLRAGYEEIAERRRTVPTPVALAMLDRRLNLLKVQTLEGSRVILESELPELEKTTTVSAVKTLKPEGDLAIFTGATWRHELGYVSHLASNREELAAALKISPALLEDNPLAGHKAKAVRIDFDGPINSRLVDRVRKMIRDQVNDGEVNLLVLWIRSEGGPLKDALDLAETLSLEVQHNQIRTVAYISGQARGSAAVVALACDEVIVEEGASLGGPGSFNHSGREFSDAQAELQEMFTPRDRPWSAALALAGNDEVLRSYSHVKRGEKRLMSEVEHSQRKDRDDWMAEVDAASLAEGLTASEAIQYGLAQHQAGRFDEVRSIYNVDSEIKTAEINWALALIERLADRRLSGLLLFIGTFALFSELSQPGLGVPGFIAGVCFLLFFWANFLHGNADLLELLLFVAGIGCVLFEVFVAPGTMVFGIGGALMIVTSIVLASQTFVLPTNYYQLQQMPGSLLMVIVAGVGGLVGMLVLQRFLPHTPYFKRLILQPPVQEQEDLDRKERLASYDYLLGKQGIALTPCVPSGKAQFGDTVVDVISDGPLIEAGSRVDVLEILGSRVRVRATG